MIDEPYRWLEAVAQRREYVATQLAGGTAVFGARMDSGLMLLGVGTGASKVFEIFDRQAMAGVGHPADIERVRQAAIDAAHMESFTRSGEDVSLRRLSGFVLGPMLKGAFEQIYSAPFLGEFLLAEVGLGAGLDVFMRLHPDGMFEVVPGAFAVAAPDVGVEPAVLRWLEASARPGMTEVETADLLLQAWWCLRGGHDLGGVVPGEEERRAGWREAVRGREVEVGVLRRAAVAGNARFERMPRGFPGV